MLHLSFLLLQSAVNWLQCKNEHDNVIVTGNGRCAEAQNKEAKSSPHKGSDFASQNKEDFMIWEDVKSYSGMRVKSVFILHRDV